MTGGDELSDFLCATDFSYLDVALIEDIEDDLMDDGVASYTACPDQYDGLTITDGLPNLESRPR
jgi:hypothetical protein